MRDPRKVNKTRSRGKGRLLNEGEAKALARGPKSTKPPRLVPAKGSKTDARLKAVKAAKPVAEPKRSRTTWQQRKNKPVRLGEVSDDVVTATPSLSEPTRIAKVMARAGVCSRREAERMIEAGRVTLNGRTLKSPAQDVTGRDAILIDGQPLPQMEPVRLWRYYKPRGLVTTHRDPEGRPTVFDNLPEGMPRVVSIGRLDFNSEGLLLLTTDGELARHLELPSTGWLRRYRVRAHGSIKQAQLDALKLGVEIEGVKYGPIEATLDTVQGANVWLTVGLREGKNREVRRILLTLGLEVNRLIRVSFGPFQLLDMKPGEAENVRRKVMADQLGLELAKKLGLAIDTPNA